jgi:hypothetical protein
VYIREAHPSDGWQMDANEEDGVIFDQAKNWSERSSVAQTCCQTLQLSMPCVVDTIDNAVDDLYAGWPERIFVIDQSGTIAYASQQGPWGFKPEKAERALDRLLRAERGRKAN